MFEALTQKLEGIFSGLRGRGKLTESDIDQAMRAIRLSLLEADVSLPVVKQLTTAIAARAKGSEVMDSLTPDQQVVKIVSDELTALMGDANVALPLASKPPTIVLMAGLQGSGKTTCSAKLARHFHAQGRAPMLVACDVYRPAAAEQLSVLGGQIGVPVHREDGVTDPVAIARNGIEAARRTGRDLVIVDTAGRLSIDADMMDELVRIKAAIDPTSVVLVVDAMTGQSAVEVAKAFGDAVDFDGVALTKLDGDARGGAALSVRAVSGKPILFIGTGEKIDALEPFYPDRMASRILGMGDVMTLIEKAQATVDVGDAKRLEQKIRGGSLTLEDFLDQMQQVRKMGPMSQVLGMIPGFRNATKGKDLQVDDGQLDRVEAIVRSMTLQERRRPEIINGSRRRRIASGSGTSVQEVNQLLSQFKQMQKLMKQMGRGGLPALLGR
ncbi:signal recognition particle protein [Miltoncostaea oceani]|jgi:signal recognition particle subunit SRP54|uniref:signal recognition particle protein n=1 Tax=Miltoncostaea oceani TaxID=2843216 RepID=UPI001C3D9A5E|nr:signal recognition particle protein [Miltoncostaea oceani]